MPDSVDSLLDLLRYLQSSRLHEVFPNVSVALRVVLTIPVTVTSGERSFSKLKLIKTYLRASMKQDRLNGYWPYFRLKMELLVNWIIQVW